MVTIGNKMKELREKKELTQTELGKQLDISRSTIASWELQPKKQLKLQLLCLFSDVGI